MKIIKKINVSIEINGKYCSIFCLSYNAETEGLPKCSFFKDEYGYLMDLAKNKYGIKRCPECIKQFGYGVKK